MKTITKGLGFPFPIYDFFARLLFTSRRLKGFAFPFPDYDLCPRLCFTMNNSRLLADVFSLFPRLRVPLHHGITTGS
jgi:hypothetical protein